MFTRLRAFWHRINASYWFYPGLFALLAVALALTTLWLDRSGMASWLGNVKAIQPARPQSASNMLTVIAGSMIGVASTVVSITIAAVAYASGNYGPRLLNNFMEDRGNQLSLATFIATFVYALTVLRAVRREDEATLLMPGEDSLPGFVPQLSLLTAYVLTGIAIAVLVYFLNHIPASIRINSVLRGIGDRLIEGIDRAYPEKNRGPRDRENRDGVPIKATYVGYVQLIDYQRLQEIAEREGGCIVLAIRTGAFVHPGVVIAWWCPAKSEQAERAEAKLPADAIRECLALGSSRTPHRDLEFLMDELVEIGLRALSPGINDPVTAITALHWIGAATARLGERDLRLKIDLENEEGGKDLVVPVEAGYSHFIARGFGAMRSMAATNRLAAVAMFDTLVNATRTLDDATRLSEIRREGEQLVRQAREHLKGPELELVEARYAGFENQMAA